MIGEYTIRHIDSSVSVPLLRRLSATRRTFIETGSNIGAGIQAALDGGFSTVYSIEGLWPFFDHCTTRFADDRRVYPLFGYSPAVLAELLHTLDEPAVIYLDAHSVAHNPLLEELRVIQQTHVRQHTILIDDVRMFDTTAWHGIQKAQALEILREINPEYRLSYEDTVNGPQDLLVAEVSI
jgi:hypothetical protein